MKILRERITLDELKQLAAGSAFGNFIKAVVDVERGLIAVDGELHSDLETLLLEDGSRNNNLWGINIYPEMQGSEIVEFDSLINIRPSVGNKSRCVENEEIRKRILRIVLEWIQV